MRTPLIAGNWKMNGTLRETRDLLGAILEGARAAPRLPDILVIPPFTALAEASRALAEAGGTIALGAQNLHPEAKGAFTGEISAEMLREIGCTHVLIGHSERRTLFLEAGDFLFRKLGAALRAQLRPILCIGERLEERESEQTESVLEAQLEETFFQLSPADATRVVLAYEPVWAIGTGRNATPEQVQGVHRHIRSVIAARHGEASSAAVSIVYGGSVTSANARGLLESPDVDGALVGGASLRAEEFLRIARAALEARAAGA